MSRVDENGVWHPTPSDPWDVQTKAHIAYCRECNLYALPIPRQGLVSPCHGAKLAVYTRMEGPAYMQSDVPSEIVCTATGCNNSWNPDGTVDYWQS